MPENEYERNARINNPTGIPGYENKNKSRALFCQVIKKDRCDTSGNFESITLVYNRDVELIEVVHEGDSKPNTPGRYYRDFGTKEISGLDVGAEEFKNLIAHAKRLGVYRRE